MDIQHVQHTERITMHRVSSMNSMYLRKYGHVKMRVKQQGYEIEGQKTSYHIFPSKMVYF